MQLVVKRFGLRYFYVYAPDAFNKRRDARLLCCLPIHPGRSSREVREALIGVFGYPDTITVRTKRDDNTLDEAR